MNGRNRRLVIEQLEARQLLSTTALPDVGAAPAADTALAIPTAEGFGAQTVGGRGGEVIEVTNLNDKGAGSLRDAIEAKGPRIVVFRVSGTIELDRALKIRNPFITIAGQSAPGGGITIKNYELSIRTHDVIVQYLRIRTGPTAEEDSISLVGAENVILDHNSFSWATDENASATRGSKNITIQWNIISEGLRNSTHPEGAHSMGSLFSGVTNLSLHHNLYAHNSARNARIGNADDAYGVQTVDVVNNVFYNWGERATEVKDYVNANIVGNYYKAGLDTAAAIEQNFPEIVLIGDDVQRSIFVDGNYSTISGGDPADDWILVGEKDGDSADRAFQSLTRHDTAAVTTTSAQDAYDQVLAQAGARLPLLDSVDERIILDVVNGTGRIIDDPSQVGAWPHMQWGEAPPDSDHDGMPDAWETQYGFDPHAAGDGRLDADGDGYTNIEEWLNGTIPVVIAPPDGAPDVNDDNAATDEDNAVIIDVAANDVAGDDGELTIVGVTQGTHGDVAIHDNGTLTYMPSLNYHGEDAFTYTVEHTDGSRYTADVVVVVRPVNDGPVAMDDLASTAQANPVTLHVLANDSDVDGDDLLVASASDGQHGTVFVDDDGSITYTPEANFVGSDSFAYTVADPFGATSTALVVIDVSCPTTLHVADLNAEGVRLGGRDWKGEVAITVQDEFGNAVAGARVTGTFRQGGQDVQVTCITDANGTCIADSGQFTTYDRDATFTVNWIEHPDLTYLPSENTDPDGGSGTSISLRRGRLNTYSGV